MKTIELVSGEQKAQFTTRSVTVGGKEFLYINMSDVVDNTTDHVYTFTYENKTHVLPYEENDAKILDAIFSQVKNMTAKQQTAHQPASVDKNAGSDSNDTNPKQQNIQTETSENVPQSDDTQNADLQDEKAAAKAEKERLRAEKKAEKERLRAEKRAEKERKKTEKETVTDPQASGDNNSEQKFSLFKSTDKNQDTTEEDPEKKAKVKKSFIIFGIVIAAMVVIALIYFFIFGTNTEPSPVNPSSTDSQTYQDIDEVIEDMQ